MLKRVSILVTSRRLTSKGSMSFSHCRYLRQSRWLSLQYIYEINIIQATSPPSW